MVNIAKVSKICVSLFAIISGYGLYLDYSKTDKVETEWIGNRLKKLMTDYWFIFLLSFFITMVIDRRPVKVYFDHNIWEGCLNVVLDFLGLSSIFGSATMLETWWYMGAAILYIVLTPVFVDNKERLWLIFVATGVLPRLFRLDYLGGANPYMFLCAFEAGMIAAHYDIVNFCINVKSKAAWFVVEIALIFLGYRLYTYLPYGKYWEICWAFFPLAVVIFSAGYLVDTPILGPALFYFGRHSYFIFLVHTFIRMTYGMSFIYNHNCFVSYGLLLATSLALALLCEKLDAALKYREAVYKIWDKMQGRMK